MFPPRRVVLSADMIGGFGRVDEPEMPEPPCPEVASSEWRAAPAATRDEGRCPMATATALRATTTDSIAVSTLSLTSVAVGRSFQSLFSAYLTTSLTSAGYFLVAASGQAYFPLITANARLPPACPIEYSNGLRPPAHAANTVHPSDHTSTRSSKSHCDGVSHSSGARKGAVHSAAADSCCASASRRSRTCTVVQGPDARSTHICVL